MVGAALALACWPTSLAAQPKQRPRDPRHRLGSVRQCRRGGSGHVTDVQTRFQRTVTTNEKGVFVAPLLPLGSYEVRARAWAWASGGDGILLRGG